jgi:hypothetical protein
MLKRKRTKRDQQYYKTLTLDLKHICSYKWILELEKLFIMYMATKQS